MKSTLAFMMAFIVCNAMADDTITVFQLDGSIHCQAADRVPLERGKQELKDAGVEVVSARSEVVPYELPGHCGTPTGNANLLVVRRADWERLRKTRPNALGYGVWVFEQPTVEVFRYDGSLQCDRGKEIPLSRMAEELKANGIEVKASRKGQDGLAHISVCGASTGNLNVYTIGKASLSKAQELGFKLLISRAMTSEIGGGAPARRGGPQARVLPRTVGSGAAPIPRLW